MPRLSGLVVKRELETAGRTPEGMLLVEAGFLFQVPLMGMPAFESRQVDRFYIGRTEVTNARFQEFVDKGAYANPEFWQERFERDGTELDFEEAMTHFRDATGRPGPSTWVLERYPDGQAQHPVAGISWYEAAAYARFRGMSLPTLYHWAHAAVLAGEIIRPLATAILL